MKTENNSKERFQVTNQHKFSIPVIFRDKYSGNEVESVISRAKLAWYYSQYQVVGSKQGLFVVEV